MEKNFHKDFFINIKPDGMDYGFGAFYLKEKDGLFSWFIPAYELYFTSNTKEEGDIIAKAMVKSFYNYWLIKKGFRSFILQILKLGFTPSSHAELQGLLRRTNLNSHLKGKIIKMPEAFKDATPMDIADNLKMAV